MDATIITAPSSTKNAAQARDPEMHQTATGKQWYFGMKAHVGVDSRTKLIHSVTATAAHVADATVLPHLLHGDETRVYGDQAYRGQTAVIRDYAPRAQDFTNRRYRHRGQVDEVERGKNRTKATVRAKVEHAIGVIKRILASQKYGIAASPRIRIASSSPVRLRMCFESATACSEARDNPARGVRKEPAPGSR